jgi:hypothetical protein
MRNPNIRKEGPPMAEVLPTIVVNTKFGTEFANVTEEMLGLKKRSIFNRIREWIYNTFGY